MNNYNKIEIDNFKVKLPESNKITKKVEMFFDDEGNVVSQEEATKARITEFDETGKVVNEIYANIKTQKKTR